MALQEKISTVVGTWVNKLEPDFLYADFLQNPPIGFEALLSPNGLPTFAANFDLMTTMDDEDRKRLTSLPFYRIWSRFLCFKTLFVGTTVSEFTPLPNALDVQDTAQYLKEKSKEGYSLVIVKDLPQHSPLLPDSDTQKTAEFLDALQKNGFITVEGQALAYVPIKHTSIDDYLANFSKNRRKDFRRKLRSLDNLTIDVLESGDPLFHDEDTLEYFYKLYIQVFNQSEIKFDQLSKDFFRDLLQTDDKNLRVMLYRDKSGSIIGYNICFIVNDMLVDKYIGLNYPDATNNNLYFISWFYNLEYARKHGLKYYIAGWTDPKIKAYLGAKFVYTRHAVFIKNPVLRWILKRFQHHFESDAHLQLQGGENQ